MLRDELNFLVNIISILGVVDRQKIFYILYILKIKGFPIKDKFKFLYNGVYSETISLKLDLLENMGVL